MNINDFVQFQTHMVKKQAVLKAEHLELIKCRYELKVGTHCIVQQTMPECLDCLTEYVLIRDQEAGRV